MKTLPFLLLTVSLALNAVVAALYLMPASGSDAAAQTPQRSTVEPVVAAKPQLDETTWKKLDAEALPDLVTRLRAGGFPPEIVRALVAAQVRESFAARRKALQANLENVPHWQNPIRDPKTQMALRALDREEQKQVRELLGDNAESDDPLMRYQRERGLEFLSADKADDVRDIVRDFEERRADLYAAGINFMVDRQKLDALEKEQQAAIARALTPEEFFEYSLRRSRTADRLRDELSAFQPTEEEYRAIFKIRDAVEQQFPGGFSPGMSQEEMRRRSEADRLAREQIKAVLTPDRAASYERMTDYNYRRTTQLIARLELPPETADRLYAVQKEIEQGRNDLYRSIRSPAERDQLAPQLQALQQEAIAKVTPLLGSPRAVEAYRQYGGTWISSLVPRPSPTAAAAAPPRP